MEIQDSIDDAAIKAAQTYHPRARSRDITASTTTARGSHRNIRKKSAKPTLYVDDDGRIMFYEELIA